MKTEQKKDEATYAQRETFIRAALEKNQLIGHIEERARRRGFEKDTEAAVNYVISEMARDETAYQAVTGGYYEAEQYSVLADMYLQTLHESVAKRKGPIPTGPHTLG